MTKPQPNPKVDAFLAEADQWQAEMKKLRTMLLGCELTEELKWGKPSYSLQGNNIVLIHGFKAYCAVLFFKGALLKDPRSLLVQQTENVQAARQIRFTSLQEIVKLEPTLKIYVREAIEIERSGQQVTYKKTSEFKLPEEFQAKLTESAALKKAFTALTPGRQRAYLLHFSGAKQSTTRASRVEKWIPQILKGKGMDDE